MGFNTLKETASSPALKFHLKRKLSLAFIASLFVFSSGANASQVCSAVFSTHTAEILPLKGTTAKPIFVYSEQSKKDLADLFKRYQVNKPLKEDQVGFRIILEKGGRDPAPFVGLHLSNGKSAVFLGCTAGEAIISTSVRSLARNGEVTQKATHAFVTGIDLFNENGKPFGVRTDGNDDSWDPKIIYEQDPTTGEIIKDNKGRPKMYIIAGTMDSQQPGEKPSAEWDGYPGEFSKNFSRQIRIFDAELAEDQKSRWGYRIVGRNPRSLFNFISPRRILVNGELREEWIISDGKRTFFAHGYGASVSRLGLWDLFFDRNGNLEVMADEVMPIGPNEPSIKRFSPHRTGIKRYIMAPNLKRVIRAGFVLSPEKSPFTNNFYRAARRSDDNGLVEGPHTIKVYQDKNGIHVIDSLKKLKAIRAKEIPIETVIVGSPGIWADAYGVWVAHRKDENSREQFVLDQNGELLDPAKILTKAFIQFGRPMIAPDENGELYLWVHGTPRFKSPEGRTAPHADERGLMVIPIRLVRLSNGQISFELKDNTGFLKALENFKPSFSLKKLENQPALQQNSPVKEAS